MLSQEHSVEIPYVDLAGQHAEIKEKLLSAVENVLEHGKFILGPEVEEFEQRFARLCGTPYAVGVGSGTDALILSLRALGIKSGDEVITSPNSFITTVAAIVAVGARPVLVDVAEDYNIDPLLIESRITSKTKAILPVHLTGHPAKMDAIMDIARKYQLYVIEDAAQAVSASFNRQKVGSFGHTGCFSLHPLKTLNAVGDGGVITTWDKQVYEELLILRNNGFRNRDECAVLSSNSRLDSLQAAMLLVKLDYLEQWTQERIKNAALYRKKLYGLKNVRVPPEGVKENPVYHTFVIQAERRDALKSYLEERGIQTKIHYPIPIHLQPAAAGLGYQRGDFPAAERQAAKILSLPVYAGLDEWRLNIVVETIKNFYEGKSE